MKRILGIEGGGTKTEWVLLSGDAAERSVVAQGVLPGSNMLLVTDDSLARLFSVRYACQYAERRGMFFVP